MAITGIGTVVPHLDVNLTGLTVFCEMRPKTFSLTQASVGTNGDPQDQESLTTPVNKAPTSTAGNSTAQTMPSLPGDETSGQGAGGVG